MVRLKTSKGMRWQAEKPKFPTLIQVRQKFSDQQIDDTRRAAAHALRDLNLSRTLSPGDRVLVTAGSRGISDIIPIIKTIIDRLQQMNLHPVILGAMGSHGGGTREGQRRVLSSLGITEESIGAKIITSDDAKKIGTCESGYGVFCDPCVFDYDGVIAVNRIKPHTTATGDIQSGLAKMLVVGLGHKYGARALHRSPPEKMSSTLAQMTEIIMQKTPFLGGIGIVENSQEKTAEINALKSNNLLDEERRLLIKSEKLMPTLPFDAADVLVVKKMGKNYSGTGMDTNVIGRVRLDGISNESKPHIDKIAVLNLSDESHGNACGVGLADYITEKLYTKIDMESTYLNVFTSRLPTRAMIPPIMETEEDAVAAAIGTCGKRDLSQLRLAVVANTLELEDIWMTPALTKQCRNEKIEIISKCDMKFDKKGGLINLNLCSL